MNKNELAKRAIQTASHAVTRDTQYAGTQRVIICAMLAYIEASLDYPEQKMGELLPIEVNNQTLYLPLQSVIEALEHDMFTVQQQPLRGATYVTD